MTLTVKEAYELFTPSEQEQMVRILKGECPHNKGWTWSGHGHNDDAYECNICFETKWW